MTSPLPTQINTTDNLLITKQRSAVIRTGRILSRTTPLTTVLVRVGDATVQAGVLDEYEPAIGDLVAVARQDASWLVLGRFRQASDVFDTGWVPFELASGIFTQGGGPDPAWRRVGIHIQFRGRCGIAATPSPNNGMAPGTVLLNVPAAIRPAVFSYFDSAARDRTIGAPSSTILELLNGGNLRFVDNLTAATATPLTPHWVSLDGVHYLLG